MTVSFLFYSHSEYSDFWPILCDNLNKLPSCFKKYICINNNAPVPNTNILHENFTKILFYEASQTYPKKLLSVLNQIDDDYVVLIHDNDFVVEFNQNDFYDLMQIIFEKNIHRCMFGIVGKANPEIIHSHFSLGTAKLHTPHFITPYDVGPSIWNRVEFMKALNQVENMEYRLIENSAIQEYCNKNLNMYGFYSHSGMSSHYVIGRPFPQPFQFLHICGSGKLFELPLYMDQKDEFLKIIKRYPDILNRGYLYNQYHIRIDNRTY